MSRRSLALIILIILSGCSKEKLRSTSTSSPIVLSAKKAGPRPVGSWTPPSSDAGASTCRYGPDTLALPPINGYCDESTCKAAAGKCVWGGFGCATVCALRTTDEGAPCENIRDCQGLCEADEKIPSGTKTKGKCNDVMVSMGCHNAVNQGVATGHMCAD